MSTFNLILWHNARSQTTRTDLGFNSDLRQTQEKWVMWTLSVKKDADVRCLLLWKRVNSLKNMTAATGMTSPLRQLWHERTDGQKETPFFIHRLQTHNKTSHEQQLTESRSSAGREEKLRSIQLCLFSGDEDNPVDRCLLLPENNRI